jgi:hypothetical protein
MEFEIGPGYSIFIFSCVGQTFWNHPLYSHAKVNLLFLTEGYPSIKIIIAIIHLGINGLNFVPPKYDKVLISSTSECNISGNRDF